MAATASGIITVETTTTKSPAAENGAPSAVLVGGPQRRQDSPENLIHVRNNQTAGFYCRLGQRMFFGGGKPAQDDAVAPSAPMMKATYDEVIITGLGRATGTAVGAAAQLCSDGRVKIVSVKTDLWESIGRGPRNGYGQQNRSGNPPPRRIPKITVTLQKVLGATGGMSSPMTNASTNAAESPAL